MPMNSSKLYTDYVALAAAIHALEQEVQDWRECALYDPLMSGPKFKGWNRSALDRCRQIYIEKEGKC